MNQIVCIHRNCLIKTAFEIVSNSIRPFLKEIEIKKLKDLLTLQTELDREQDPEPMNIEIETEEITEYPGNTNEDPERILKEY